MRTLREESVFLPLRVHFVGNRVFVADASLASEKITTGAEILSINNQPVQEIVSEIFGHLSGDGFIESGKRLQCQRYFHVYYNLFVDPVSEDFDIVTVFDSHQGREVKLKGRSLEEVERLPPMYQPDTQLLLRHRENYSYMKIGAFYNVPNYESFLSQSFGELREREVENLVLDLRQNGGGTDNYGALLVSYFAREEFGYFHEIEVTPSYKGYGRVVVEDEKYLMMSHQGLGIWKPQQNRFRGKTYLLVDGGCFSTCADVATLLDFHELAVLIGEETGGGYDGNTSGYSERIVLPHSKISVNLPMWKYTTANLGHRYFGKGALPAYRILPTVEDKEQGQDPALEKAKMLMSEN